MFQFCAKPPTNDTEAHRTLDGELAHLVHLGLLNRGVMITPFHNTMLVCPATTEADVQRLLTALDELLGAIKAL